MTLLSYRDFRSSEDSADMISPVQLFQSMRTHAAIIIAFGERAMVKPSCSMTLGKHEFPA